MLYVFLAVSAGCLSSAMAKLLAALVTKIHGIPDHGSLIQQRTTISCEPRRVCQQLYSGCLNLLKLLRFATMPLNSFLAVAVKAAFTDFPASCSFRRNALNFAE